METKNIISWDAWKKEIANFQIENEGDNGDGRYVSDLLFRGQKCASWKLDSTLERKVKQLPSIDEYNDSVIKSTKAAFESLTEKVWNTVFENKTHPTPPEDYEFLVYLRHHGFPTPILDWSRSPYVASYFAFNEKSLEDEVAIYTYREYNGNCKSGWTSQSNVVECGPTIRTHRRHYLQQAHYTYCRKKIDGVLFYSNHEEAFSVSNGNQDVLTKYILPASLRKEALADLDAMNINAYSLYGSEEGLAEMLSNRVYGYNS